MAVSATLSLPDLPPQPIHPPSHFVFPKREFGKKHVVKRSCQTSWFSTWPWLHYQATNPDDVVFCHVCVSALKSKRMDPSRGDNAFTSSGFKNWKDATISFKNHEASASHKQALQVVVVIPSTFPDVGEMLSREHAQEKSENRQCLLRILSNIRFLSRQGLAFRGDGDEADSNFIQLLKLRGLDDPRIDTWLSRKTNKYTSNNAQNEILKVMALSALRKITAELSQTQFFCIMSDESTDASNREQLVICIRWVDSNLEAHEEFIGLYKLDNIKANSIVAAIRDALIRLNLAMSKCRGQCYDGASTMKGEKSGVATQLLNDEPRAVYIHCYGHALNLAVGDTVKGCKVLKDTLETTFEVSKLVKFSPKRGVQFDKLKVDLAPDSPGFRVLCPTRWTVRAASLKSVIDNYTVLQELWELSQDEASDPSTKARIIGVEAQFKTFRYYFGAQLGFLLLQHSDNLSKTLQSPKLCASEGQRVAAMTVATLQRIRDDQSFDLFWQKVERERQSLDVQEPLLPRRRKTPRRFDDGNTEGEFPDDPKLFYRQQYYEALDLIISSINDRFDQPGYRIYQQMEDLLLKAVRKEDFEDCLTTVTSFYHSDFNAAQLHLHLDILASNFPDNDRASASVMDIKEYVQKMSVPQRQLIAEVSTLLQLFLVLPSTNAISERSFSALRRVKNYLRSSMTQERLNHLLLLHAHKQLTDSMDLIAVANDFVAL